MIIQRDEPGQSEIGDEGLRTEEMILNLGPQHPSTHGVLRLILKLEGETVVECIPVLGYLHRGIEKILENRTYHVGIRYLDQLDYLSVMINESCWVMTVEQLMGLDIPRRGQYIRLICSELQRIASHLVGLGTYLLDLGAFTPVLYAFRERETIMSLFEAVGGSRFNNNYMRVGGVLWDLPAGWLKTVDKFVNVDLPKNMQEFVELIIGNEIFETRTQGVGYVDPKKGIDYGVTGPMIRASGVAMDLRVDQPYGAYREIKTRPVVRTDGDAFGRFQVRMGEIDESMRLIREAMEKLPGGPPSVKMPHILRPPRGETYFAVESSKGELGIYLISDGSEYPYRVKLRGPSFVNLQLLPELVKGKKMGDVIAILGSVDIVLGEVDR